MTNMAPLNEDRIAYLEALVAQGRTAAAVFTQFTQQEVDRIVKAIVLAGLEQAQYLARLAIEETKLGVLEDKAIKNMVATEFVYNYVRDKRSVGAIHEFPERGLVEVAEPVGLIFSLTPVTNPTSTVLFKAIMAVKTRNAVLFGPHPRAWHCSAEAVRIMYEAAVKHGSPEGVFTCLESPTLQDNAYLMHHNDVQLIDATGGPGVVKAAYSSGKPALGVGPGNTPVYLEKTAHLEMAVVDIITSKTFDNGTICASEQTVVIDDEIYDSALQKFADLGAHLCDEEETDLLGRMIIDPETGFVRPIAVGQKAVDIARVCGLRAGPDTKLLIAPIKGVGREHPLSAEKLCPVLSVYRAGSVDEALRVCMEVNYAGGVGHTAVIFSRNDEIIRKFGEAINAGRIIVNSPGSIGALGGVYNDMVPTFSFGCGTGGGNSTMDNVNLYHYLNIKRVARRRPAHMWFRVPNQIYFNLNSVENLGHFPSRSTVIVTNPFLEGKGHVDLVRRSIPPGTPVRVLAIPDAEPELARRLAREGHRRDARERDRGGCVVGRRDHPGEPVHEEGGLAGPGAGVHEDVHAARRDGAVALGLVRKRRAPAHAPPVRSAMKSATAPVAPAARAPERAGTSAPQTGRNGQKAQSSSAGVGGNDRSERSRAESTSQPFVAASRRP